MTGNQGDPDQTSCLSDREAMKKSQLDAGGSMGKGKRSGRRGRVESGRGEEQGRTLCLCLAFKVPVKGTGQMGIKMEELPPVPSCTSFRYRRNYFPPCGEKDTEAQRRNRTCHGLHSQ